MQAIADQDAKIMKIKFSNMNLHTYSGEIVHTMCDIIKINKALIFCDLSWAKLIPKDLVMIAFQLGRTAKSLRNLNLSYNKLSFKSDEQVVGFHAVKFSNEFIDNIEMLLEEAIFINHINFSGMNLGDA